MALASAFIVLRRGSDVWVTVHLPPNSFGNTVILLASSFALETARRRSLSPDPPGFRKLWLLTTGLGDLICCRTADCLAATGRASVYIRKQPGSSFFYIFTARTRSTSWAASAHSLRFFRKSDQKNISLSTAAEIAFLLLGISWTVWWVFLLALLYLEND